MPIKTSALPIQKKGFSAEIQTELIRKSIHLLIALVPVSVTLIGVTFTLGLLALGTITYAYAESLRNRGFQVYLISTITKAAARKRDEGKYILGPVTLGIGAMLSLLLYPEPAASIAIYALAFGDGFASLVGKLFGTTRLPLLRGKTIEGSMSCFIIVFLAAFRIVNSIEYALAVAFTATILEAVPIRDLDNLIIPIGTGLAAYILLPVLI